MKVYVGVARNGIGALWIGGLACLAIFFAAWDEPILTRISVAGGIFLYGFLITGYFHLIVLSNKRYFHLYNWMLMPLFGIVRWKKIQEVRLVGYDRKIEEELSETKMVVERDCSPMLNIKLMSSKSNKNLNDQLINYLHLVVGNAKYVIPLDAFRNPNRIICSILDHINSEKSGFEFKGSE